MACLREQEYALVAVDALRPHPANPRKGDVAGIAGSVAANGFYGAVVAQRGTGFLLAGNHRWEAARREGLAEIPVLWLDCTAAEAKRILLVDNRTNDAASYDEAALARVLEEIRVESAGLEGTGWTPEAFDALIAEIGDAALHDARVSNLEPGGDDDVGRSLPSDFEKGEAPAPEDPDRVDEIITSADRLREKWGTESGQLWLIPSVSVPGQAHRLICGNSCDSAVVERLMCGKRAGLMNTDPPYGVSLKLEQNHMASNAAKGNDKSYRHFSQIMGDDLEGEKLQEFLEAIFRTALTALLPNAAWYLWHAQLTQGFFAAAAAEAASLLIHRQIIWRKPHFVFGRGDYHWKHELAFYGWVKGNRPPFYGERNQTTVWEIAEGGGSIRKDQHHPTQKPTALFEIPIRNHLRSGEICFEPFSGSGSQFVAAEREWVLCYGIELEAKYVAVALERMAGLGCVPKLAE